MAWIGGTEILNSMGLRTGLWGKAWNSKWLCPFSPSPLPVGDSMCQVTVSQQPRSPIPPEHG